MVTTAFVKMFREESSSDYLRCRMSPSKHPAVSSGRCHMVQLNKTLRQMGGHLSEHSLSPLCTHPFGV